MTDSPAAGRAPAPGPAPRCGGRPEPSAYRDGLSAAGAYLLVGIDSVLQWALSADKEEMQRFVSDLVCRGAFQADQLYFELQCELGYEHDEDDDPEIVGGPGAREPDSPTETPGV